MHERYLQSFFDCVTSSYTSSNPVYKVFDIPLAELKQHFFEEISDKSLWKTTILAIDSTNDQVVGSFQGKDIHDHIDPNISPKKNPFLHAIDQIVYTLIKPIKSKYQKRGEAIKGQYFCVHPDYSNSKIGQMISIEFYKNALELGYQCQFGIFFNKVSSHIMYKFGNKVLNEMYINQMEVNGEKIFASFDYPISAIGNELNDEIQLNSKL